MTFEREHKTTAERASITVERSQFKLPLKRASITIERSQCKRPLKRSLKWPLKGASSKSSRFRSYIRPAWKLRECARHWAGPARRLAFLLSSPTHSIFCSESSQSGLLAVTRVGPRLPLLKVSEHSAGLRHASTIMGKRMEPISLTSMLTKHRAGTW